MKSIRTLLMLMLMRRLPFFMCICDVEATWNKLGFEKDIIDGFKLHVGNLGLIRQLSNRRQSGTEWSHRKSGDEFAETDRMIA